MKTVFERFEIRSKDVYRFNIDFSRGVVRKNIKVDRAAEYRRTGRCFPSDICSFNARYHQGFVSVGIPYISHQSHDAPGLL